MPQSLFVFCSCHFLQFLKSHVITVKAIMSARVTVKCRCRPRVMVSSLQAVTVSQSFLPSFWDMKCVSLTVTVLYHIAPLDGLGETVSSQKLKSKHHSLEHGMSRIIMAASASVSVRYTSLQKQQNRRYPSHQ